MGRLLRGLRGDAAAAGVRDLTRDRRGGSPSVMLMPLSLVALELAVLAYRAAHKQLDQRFSAIMVSRYVFDWNKKIDGPFKFQLPGENFKEVLSCMSFIPFLKRQYLNMIPRLQNIRINHFLLLSKYK